MTKAVEAIFEDGVFKPLTRPDIIEHQKVHVLVELPLVIGQSAQWHWTEARAIDDGFAGSVSDEVSRQRQER